VRPRGLTTSVAPLVAGAIEDLATRHHGAAATTPAVVSRA
jgi:hypothetical protein